MFDCNKTLIAPFGTIVLFHEKTTNCLIWVPLETDGWYIGPSLEHYQCMECYTPSNYSTRIVDIVKFIPSVVPLPKTSSEGYLRQLIGDIIAFLAYPKPTVYSLSLGDNTQNKIK